MAQSALAGLLGVDPGTLSRWERGLRVPIGKYEQLAEALLERPAADIPLMRPYELRVAKTALIPLMTQASLTTLPSAGTADTLPAVQPNMAESNVGVGLGASR